MLNNFGDKPFDEVRELGAVIAEPRPDQRHVGFLYKLEDQPARMVHLAWHFDLRNGAPTSTYWWVQSGLDETNRLAIAPAVAEVASEQQLPIPYSPFYEGLYFEAGTLRYVAGAPGHGLTCATFVMAVLDALGFPLFNVEEWPARPEDAEWHEAIIGTLEDMPGATEEHIEAIRSRRRGARFRPEEVAGSVAEQNPPVSFELAQALGREVLVEMRRP